MALRDHIEELEPSGLILIGGLLFVIPEPATSTLGLGMMLLGLVWGIRAWQ